MTKIYKHICSDRPSYFFDDRCHIAPLVAAGLIAGAGSALGSLFSGIFGSSSSSEAAEINAQIARETNANNYLMNQQTNRTNEEIASQYNANQVELQNDMNDFNLRMWNLNNAYNSPLSVLERAKEAGINPNSAMGFAVPSSPVQQSSIPQQAMPKYESSKDEAYTGAVAKDFSFIKDLASQVAELPMYKEKLDSIRLDNKRKAIDNELRQYELDAAQDEAGLFKNVSYIRALDGSGDMVTKDDFENMTPVEQQRFLKPVGYRHSISDKVVSPEVYDNLPQEQKSLYVKSFDGSLPDVVKLPVHSRQAFEAWKSLMAAPNVLENVKADKLQNRLRSAVSDGQLKSTDYIQSMIDMQPKVFDKLCRDIQKADKDIEYSTKINENLSERLKNQDDLLRYTARKAESMMDSDTINIIKKYVPEGGFQDFLITAVAVIRELSGASSITQYASLFGVGKGK